MILFKWEEYFFGSHKYVFVQINSLFVAKPIYIHFLIQLGALLPIAHVSPPAPILIPCMVLIVLESFVKAPKYDLVYTQLLKNHETLSCIRPTGIFYIDSYKFLHYKVRNKRLFPSRTVCKKIFFLRWITSTEMVLL